MPSHPIKVREGLHRVPPTHRNIQVRQAIQFMPKESVTGCCCMPLMTRIAKVESGHTLATMPASAGSCSLKEAFLKADTSTRLPSTGTSMMGKLRPTSIAPLNSFFT